MEIVTETTQAPGLCVFTGTASGPKLDTGRWIPYTDAYGYVQVDFVKEMGRAVGMIDALEHSRLKGRIREKELLAEKMEAQLAELKHQVEALQTVKELVNA